jgi:hypothetical protein
VGLQCAHRDHEVVFGGAFHEKNGFRISNSAPPILNEPAGRGELEIESLYESRQWRLPRRHLQPEGRAPGQGRTQLQARELPTETRPALTRAAAGNPQHPIQIAGSRGRALRRGR